MEIKEEYYITVFSLRLYRLLKKHNIFPYEIQTNRKFPEYNVFKYHDDKEIRKIINQYKEERTNEKRNMEGDSGLS